MNLSESLTLARLEIGKISPWWSPEDNMYVFESALYPRVIYGDTDKEECITGYIRALKEFLRHRLAGDLSGDADQVTPGLAGN